MKIWYFFIILELSIFLFLMLFKQFIKDKQRLENRDASLWAVGHLSKQRNPVNIQCPNCNDYSYGSLHSFFIHVNDMHDMPFNEIADIIEQQGADLTLGIVDVRSNFKYASNRYKRALGTIKSRFKG